MLTGHVPLLSKKVWGKLTQLMMNKSPFSHTLPVRDVIQVLGFDPPERQDNSF